MRNPTAAAARPDHALRDGDAVRQTPAAQRPAGRLLHTIMLAALLAGQGHCGAASAQSAIIDQNPVHPTIWPQGKWPLATDAAMEQRIADLLKRMTVEEKVGQIIQADIESITPEEARRFNIGSILNGGNSAPNDDEFAPPAAWLKLADEFWSASVDKTDGRTGIPIIWGTDAVHGHANVVGATIFPHNIGLGAGRNPDLVRKISAATAIEVRTTGMEWTFAPTLTVPQDDRWGRSYEGFSEDPAEVAALSAAVVEGVQGKVGTREFLDERHVMTSAKHYLADGGTDGGRDQGDALTSEEALRDVHGAGYYPAINAGAQSVMISFSSWRGEKLTGHRGLMTDVLKGRLDFQGFAVSDWNAHGQIAGCTNESCPRAVNAGLDMYMAPDSWKPLWLSTLAQVRSGVIPMSRLNDAVARILRVKMRMRLFEAPAPSRRALGGKFELLGSPEHRALARQAVRESLVLLKNQRQLLPLKPKAHILVTGEGADDLAQQSGGWTLTWQGTGVERKHFPGATSIWEGIEAAVKAGGGSAERSRDARYRAKPDAAIVVFGEQPYAEFQGDTKVLALPHSEHLETMRALKAQGIPVVAVFLSGRPLWQNRELNLADAYVAAWLPGSEGGGIADMLFRRPDGSVAYDFRGRLSRSWPRTAGQTPLNFGQANYDPLFPLRFGLTVQDKGDLATLPEDPGVSLADLTPGVYLDKGAPIQPWSLVASTDKEQLLRITTTPAATRDNLLTVRATDYKAQEDSRIVTWKGGEPTTLEIVGLNPVDLSRESNGDIMLQITARIDAAPGGDATLSMRCGEGCSASVPVGDALRKVQPGEWTTIGVMLKCFEQAGANMKAITAPFVLTSASPMQVTLNKIELNITAPTRVPCK